MTIKQAIQRYLKEAGLYGCISKHIHKKLFEVESGREIIQLFDVILRLEGVYWRYRGNVFAFISEWLENGCNIKSGDVVTVSTLDGKYFFDYKVFDVWHSTFQFEDYNGAKINMERIVAVNGKPADFKNSWKFKKNIQKVHK